MPPAADRDRPAVAQTRAQPAPHGARTGCLVLLETSGNQRYIFDTNRRRENVGASQLIWAVGGRWFPEAITTLQLALCNSLEEFTETRVLPLVAASGKVLCLVGSHALGRSLVRLLTLRALRDAPGLDLAGCVGREFALHAEPLADEVMEVHRLFQGARASRPGPELRFQRLPVGAPCPSSGLPASALRRIGDEVEERSASSAAKFDAAEQAMARLAPLLGLGSDAARWRAAINRLMQQLEGEQSRGVGARRAKAASTGDGAPPRVEEVAVIHADGNGLGALFLSLHARTTGDDVYARNGDYVRRLAGLSRAVDTASRFAFARALESVRTTTDLPPILPLVLGGDDLTIVCDGRIALPFTKAYLDAFESFARLQHRDAHDRAAAAIIGECTHRHDGGAAGLSACAGVAIVKPHHPFTQAYDLAEELLASAKVVKREVVATVGDQVAPVPCSAFDVHVLLDSAAADLAHIRGELTYHEGATTVQLFARPIVTTPLERLTGLAGDVRAWVTRRHWDRLLDRVAAIDRGARRGSPSRDGGARPATRRIPRSQLYDLRDAALGGTVRGNQRFMELARRYGAASMAPFGAESFRTGADTRDDTGAELFWHDVARTAAPGAGSTRLVSTIADVLDLLPYVHAPVRPQVVQVEAAT